MKQLKLYLMTALLSMVVGQAWGATYYAKVTAQIATNSTNLGTVAAATSSTTPKDGDFETSKSVTGSRSNNTSVNNLYIFAKAKEGYVFAGWSKNADGSSITSTANPYNLTVTSNKTSSTSPTNGGTYYAVFKKLCYGKATAIALTGGKVYVTTDATSNPLPAAYTGTVSKTNSGTQGSDVKLYLWARANEGYTFEGWSKNSDGSGNLTNVDQTKSYTTVNVSNIQGTTEAGATDGGTYYAVFKKNASNSNYAILNYGNSQYLGINSAKLAFSTTAQDWSITYSSTSKYYTFKNSSYNLYYNPSTIRPSTSNSTGLYLFKIADINASNNWSATQVATANIEPGYYFIARKSSSSNYYYPIGNSINTNGYISSISSTALASSSGNYTFKKSNNNQYVYYIGPTATLNIGATGYATYSNQDFDIAVPSDGTTTLYGAQLTASNETVRLIELPNGTKAIKKGTGLVVKGTPNSTVTFCAATGGTTISGNNLIASGVAGTYFGSEETIYILTASGAGSAVFKKNNFYEAPDQAGKNILAPNKAYLNVAKTQPLTKEILEIDEATGIERVNAASSKSSKAYNLNGMRVNKNYKGLIIKDGKKFLNR